MVHFDYWGQHRLPIIMVHPPIPTTAVWCPLQVLRNKKRATAKGPHRLAKFPWRLTDGLPISLLDGERFFLDL